VTEKPGPTAGGGDDAEPEVVAKPKPDDKKPDDKKPDDTKPDDDGGGGEDAAFMPGKMTWFELFTADPAKAGRFYGQLLGWEISETNAGPVKASAIKNGGDEIGLIIDAAKAPMPKGWMAYISVAEVDDAALDAKGNGGKIVIRPMDVKEVGVRFAILADPDGSTIGIAHRESGDPPDRQSPGDWRWAQLMASDPDDCYSFYSAVAGYTRHEQTIGGVNYIRLIGDELPRAVITKVEKGFAPGWIPWVVVADVDATVAKAKKLGGKVRKAAWNAGDLGRIALLQDPTGGVFGVVAPPAAP
jgi:predicted enzyme related to lactoylglutathione lyase